MLILSFESSCDETSCAVVAMEDGRREILSNIIASQIEVHRLYGGVVPEIASRAHTEAISRITREALDEAGVTMEDIDAVATTNSPGLIGTLLVGVNFAKGIAFAHKKPLIPVNHIHGHIAANYLEYPELKPPFTALVASGGHTSIIHVKDYTNFETIGATRDDAIGEAFDKVARLLGLCYPGGAEMDALAKKGNPDAISFPSAAIAGDTLDMSFSGLKTAVINYIHNASQKNEEISAEDVSASFTKTVCNSVVKRLGAALDATGSDKLVLAGGVSANSHLRRALSELAEQKNVTLYMPPLSLCGDNAAMIGAQGYYEYLSGNLADTSLNAFATKR
ncbi:MAG: tRNA (adenosine(37)-N6)-threonylcarbamoyltransferase complex transferase subunit TsaD [Clostridia bacterium]|nr:tRNA (adenosine(37)-N6)-threonylcarbamoyltransferase complex transferase subunit TsaD [Clostridia bacterium]